ncbi:MAG TPA: methyltransferase [Gemmatimonadales bacterium]|nr:methyltransferase [Gemmatimonadales bacterium]
MRRTLFALPTGGALRARILARVSSARWQAWASSFWLTRPFARRASRRVFDLCAGFVYTQVLLAVTRLQLLEMLVDGPLDADALEVRTGLPSDSLARLLSAAVALELLVRRRDGRYDIGPLGMSLVGRHDFAALFEHNTLLYRDLVDPVALLRAGRTSETLLAQFWPYAVSDAPSGVAPDAAAAYSAVMAASQPQVAAEALAAYDVRRHRVHLDLGGGEGVFLGEAAARHPTLALHLFDLPAVAERGKAALEAKGFGDRLTVTGGDFFRDPLPTGADLISLVRVLHDHDDAPVRALLRKAHAALAPGGTLLVIEPMAGVAGAEMVGEAYFALYLLAMGSGRARTPDELTAMLREAGFREVSARPVRSPIRTGVLVARK